YAKEQLTANGLSAQALSSPGVLSAAVEQLFLTDNNWLCQMTAFFPDARSAEGNVSDRVKKYTESVVKQAL
ncbi:MAG: hypothetical protein R3194_10105, partial [Limnobacter sp.]|nr:hypothetical protein [Limnobacter sp.]